MRWIVRLIGAVLLVAVLAAAALFLIPSEKIAGFAAREITARTGRTVTFDGGIRPTFWPVIGVRTGGFAIGNADWSDGEPMVTAKALLVGVELAPLLSGDVRVTEFRLQSPVVRLEKARDGRVNWALTDGASPSTAVTGAAGDPLPEFSLADARIEDGSVTYVDHQTGQTLSLSGFDLALAVPKAAGPADLSGRLSLNGQTVAFDTWVARFDDLVAGRLSDLTLSARGGFGTVTFDGVAGHDPVSAEGQVVAEIADLDAAMALGGLGGGIGRTGRFAGRITYTEKGTLHLRGAAIALDGNAARIEADVTLADRPSVTARIEAGALDFAALTGAGDGAGSADSGAGWSTDPIDLSGLHALDADVALVASSVDLGVIRTGIVRTRATLDKGRLVLDLQQVSAYDGTIAGEFVVNARGGMSAGGDLTFDAIDLQPLLVDMADYDRLRAAGGGRLKFLVSGRSMDAMMKSLSGFGSLAIGQGEIIGFDLAGMIRNLDPSYRGASDKTIFSSITGSFTIDGGVLLNDDLAFRSPVLTATGAGQVDIGRQTQTYRVTPVAFSETEAGDTGRVLVPVLIDGTWSDVRFRLDLSSVVNDEIDKNRKEAEEKLKGTVEEVRKDTEERLRNEAEKALREGIEKSLGDLLKKLP
jgi:AsmA protein